eukprot:scaffold2893_cov254-Pinguiococcus_pyrenoidosus.AAC.10
MDLREVLLYGTVLHGDFRTLNCGTAELPHTRYRNGAPLKFSQESGLSASREASEDGWCRRSHRRVGYHGGYTEKGRPREAHCGEDAAGLRNAGGNLSAMRPEHRCFPPSCCFPPHVAADARGLSVPLLHASAAEEPGWADHLCGLR